MPVHDWMLVDGGIFHALGIKWIAAIDSRLNGGLLPAGYYSLPEQHTGHGVADIEYRAVGASLPEMPLFLESGRYINVPLESTYMEAYGGMPGYWRGVLEGANPF